MSSLLIHITDLHLLAAPSGCLHGWDVDRAFNAVLDDISARYPDFDALLLGGDLVDDLSPAGYERLNIRLATLGVPILAVAGNHDAPALMQEKLSCCRVHERLLIGSWQVIGLNTHVPGHEHGAIGEHAIEELDRQLSADPRPALLMLHHPPLAVGAAWIDAIGLADARALAASIASFAHVRGVLTGHVHQVFTGEIAGRPVWTTPSTMRQFLPGASSFAEDENARPGYRTLRLFDNGQIESSVRRLA